MQKVSRLLLIENIISTEDIASQEELLKRLKGEGISCTQATLSRNLRQLGVLRVPNGKGGYKYSFSERRMPSPGISSTFNIILAIRSIIDTKGMIIIKTVPGYASSVAVFIDNAGRYEIAGTIAGDDTLLIIPRDDISLSHSHTCLEMILPGLHRQAKGE
jgi:transcriptional regulator of arginine metabolism